jgi:hypothetical protein
VTQGRICMGASALVALSVIAAALWTAWFIVAAVVAGAIAVRLWRPVGFNLIQERALILAIEIWQSISQGGVVTILKLRLRQNIG